MARRLTDAVLRRLIAEEKRRLVETLELQLKHPSDAPKRTREVKADGFQDTLEDKIDHYKAMKIHEAELLKQYLKLREARTRLKSRLLKEIQ